MTPYESFLSSTEISEGNIGAGLGFLGKETWGYDWIDVSWQLESHKEYER